MNRYDLIRSLSVKTDTRIVLLVLDGGGGLPDPATGLTEMETAATPNLDRLAAGATCGGTDPILPGVTPGSGPAHLALFGYDPLESNIGRGMLAAAGVGFPLQPGDVAARINFASLDAERRVTDRRAGRIPNEVCERLCAKLSQITIEGAEVFVQAVKQHRAAVVFRGDGLGAAINDSDPQQVGAAPLALVGADAASARTVELANTFLKQAFEVLADDHPANGILLRGWAEYPRLPSFPEVYKLTPACIATYPMYRGVARFAGMEVLQVPGETIAAEIDVLEQRWNDFDFFFVHFKATDAAGEDGDFARKAALFEEVDAQIPRIEALGPAAFVVTSDHSTPAVHKAHSWHPAPFVLASPNALPDAVEAFSERRLVTGGLGRFPARDAMLLMMAHALKLDKYGA